MGKHTPLQEAWPRRRQRRAMARPRGRSSVSAFAQATDLAHFMLRSRGVRRKRDRAAAAASQGTRSEQLPVQDGGARAPARRAPA